MMEGLGAGGLLFTYLDLDGLQDTLSGADVHDELLHATNHTAAVQLQKEGRDGRGGRGGCDR